MPGSPSREPGAKFCRYVLQVAELASLELLLGLLDRPERVVVQIFPG